jgi:hypothetical protein
VNVTIQGYQFDVPPAGLVVGDPKTENEVHVLEQVRIENIRNNFAPKIKKLLNGSETLTEEQLATARQEVAAYANEYKFGQRKAGGGATRVTDPVEREVIRLGREDIQAAYFARHGERLKSVPQEALDNLFNAKRDEYVKRARRNLADRQRAGEEVLAAAGV